MLRAAYELFCERGFAGTTMSLIAERAGVAVQTLYFTFNTKAAILKESLGACIAGFESWDPSIEAVMSADPQAAFAQIHPWLEKLEQVESYRDALAVLVDEALPVLERAGPLVLVMSEAAGSDEEVRAAAQVAEQRRVQGFAHFVNALAKHHALRHSPQRATDILLTLLSAPVHEQLVLRQWSRQERRDWLLEALEQQLLAD